jgi:ABC-type dipeptide/oligopeptide/nickel transport system permease component/ABC-type transport system substrate-binding protein
MKSVFRATTVFVLVTLAFFLGVWGLAKAARGKISRAPAVFDPQEAQAAAKLRDVASELEPATRPTPYKDIHVTPKNESPLLKDLVDKGELPPLKERMPEDPVVMEGPEGIGQYGGTWLRLAVAEADISGNATWRMAGSFLCRWSPLGKPVKPFIAKSVEPSDNFKTWTITLRKGIRWSNGDPYTANDIMYWWVDEVQNPILQNLKKGQQPTWPAWLLVDGKPPKIEKIDDYQIRVSFVAPYPFFEEKLCTHEGGNMVGAPSRYMRQYHPDPSIGNKELIARDVKNYKQPSAKALYSYMRSYQNTDMPRLSPWIYKSYRSRPPQVFVRNPYYFVVDPQGNQLPYIDRVQYEVKENNQIMTISVANGDSTMQDRNVDFSGYTEFMSRREHSGTRVLHWYPATRQIWVINVNNNRKVDPADPATSQKEKLLSDKRFRQAMSLAINRKQIIQAEYYGVGEPSQVSPGPGSPFENHDLAKMYTDFEPARANKLLDDLGLTKRDYEGYRTFPDRSGGGRMTFFLDISPFTGDGPAQFVIDDWKAVGVRVMRRTVSRGLWTAYANSGDYDFTVWTSESDIFPLPNPWPSYFVASHSFFAPFWSRWFDAGGFYHNPRAEKVGYSPLKSGDNGKPMFRAMKLYENAMHATDPSEQVRIFREIQKIAAENVWSIGLATAPPSLAVVDKNLRNVPERALVGATFSNPVNTGIETYFFANPQPNPSADSALEDAIVNPTNRPGSTGPKKAAPTLGAKLIRYMIIGIILALIAMAIVRHPFIGRRLLILVPTLAIISVIIFTIIQLPPGDFLSNRRAQLEAEGSPNLEQQLDDLRIQFHTDDPAWKNYFRWVGLKWFTSFKASDEGLLQGNLGRSMESNLPVNNIIGDRITLTVLLSLGTVLFTWILALPIGIYSAVRQYTPSDYALTLLGFIGMSVPAFLLALILMAASGFTGLFSPEFATQPGWSWGKFIDLSEHLWIPILVLAVGGTAGMIRIMRANLLDELKKPYVTTARAKGVRPLKLLLKYPVRIALNPFVSGIGHLFPALVSGGSIVAIVLSLPMVGPVLLDSLFAQDAYLAGSMLMVLSLLGVLGTLVSDLLLLWLDPRIRFEGGSR